MQKSASFFAAVALALAVAGCNGYDKEAFTATLNAASEVPATAETATGQMTLTFNGPVAEWTLTTSGTFTTAPTYIRLQSGDATANSTTSGAYVVLWDGPSTAFASTLKGSFIADQLTACTTTGTTTCLAAATRTFANTQAAAETHTLFVNVVTATGANLIRGNF